MEEKGTDDEVAPLEHWDSLKLLIENARLVKVVGATHGVFMEFPERVAALLHTQFSV